MAATIRERPKYLETPDALAARVERANEIRPRIEEVIQTILREEGWPPHLRPKAMAIFADHAVRSCLEARVPELWAGRNFAARKRGAISSLQVLFNERAQFRNKKGRLQPAKANASWVLDCWEVALQEWEGTRQMRLL